VTDEHRRLRGLGDAFGVWHSRYTQSRMTDKTEGSHHVSGGSAYIDGAWTEAAARRSLPVVSPATGEVVGKVAHAERADLDRALEAADKGFRQWRKVSAYDRSKVMRKAADLLRERANAIAPLLTTEQGKPLPEAKGEVFGGRRRDRLVCRRGAPHLWPRVAGPCRGHLPACHQGTGWSGRRIHTVELPDQPGRAKTLLCTRVRMFHHRQGAGRNTRLTGGTDPLLCRCRRAGRGYEPGIWRAGGNLRISHSASRSFARCRSPDRPLSANSLPRSPGRI